MTESSSTRFEYFAGVWQSVADRGRALVGLKRPAPLDVEALIELSAKLIAGRGEASRAATAQAILSGFAALSEAGRGTIWRGPTPRSAPISKRWRRSRARSWRRRTPCARRKCSRAPSRPGRS